MFFYFLRELAQVTPYYTTFFNDLDKDITEIIRCAALWINSQKV